MAYIAEPGRIFRAKEACIIFLGTLLIAGLAVLLRETEEEEEAAQDL